VYSDGSGYKGSIGAAAVAQGADNQLWVHHCYLGTDKSHTVIEGELVGAILALDIIASEPQITMAQILLDNQA
ncbi:hypothetical protein SCHPADRAFT_806545, partial [Schizopora paradoxa]